MESDVLDARLCRVGLLCGALLHWFTAAFLLWPHSASTTWHYSPRLISRFADTLVTTVHLWL